MKKLTSLILALVMIFSLAAPAMAAEGDGQVSGTYTPEITITDIVLSGDAVTVDEDNKIYTVTIPEDADYVDVTVTVSGTNLAYITAEDGSNGKYMIINNAVAITVTEECVVNDTWTYTDQFANEGTTHQQYSTDGGTTWTPTDWTISVVKEGSATETVYTVVGGFPDHYWDPADESMVMTWNEENSRYELVMTDVAADTYEYKVIEGSDWSGNQWNDVGDATYSGLNASVTVEKDGSTVTFTFDGTKTGTIVTPPAEEPSTTKTIYFTSDGNGFGSTVYAYYWSDDNTQMTVWPGTAMTLVDGETNIYSVEVPADATYIIFSNNGINQTDDLTIPTDGKNMYTASTGEWSAYPPAKITGVSVTIDGITYDGTSTSETSPAVITPDSTVIVTLTGTDLDHAYLNFDDSVMVNYASGLNDGPYSGYWTFSNNGTTATRAVPATYYATTTTAFEITYTNDNRATETKTGIWVIYESSFTGTSEITGVSVTIDGTTYNSTNTSEESPAVITPDSTVIVTLTGTGLDEAYKNGIAKHRVGYAKGVDDGPFSGSWDISEDGTTATRTMWAGYYATTTTAYEITYTNDDYVTIENTGIWIIYDDGTTETTYTVTTYVNGSGTMKVKDADGNETTSFAAGDTVTVTMTPEDGYVLFGKKAVNPDDTTKSVELTQGADIYTYTFEMPEYNVSVDAYFCKDGKAREDLYFNNGGNNDWTTVKASFYTDIDRWIEDVQLTMVEEGVYAIPEGKIPNYAYRVYFYSMTDQYTTLVDIPLDGEGTNNMFTLGTTTDEDGNYEGTWSEYTPSTPSTPTSVNITWGNLAYTYSDETSAWSVAAVESGKQANDTVIVTNNGTAAVTASVSYAATEDYKDIGVTGTFDKDSEEVAASASATFTLTLSGKPSKALNGDQIGLVTVTITEVADPITITFVDYAFETDTNTLESYTFYDADGKVLSSASGLAKGFLQETVVNVPAGAVTFDYSYVARIQGMSSEQLLKNIAVPDVSSTINVSMWTLTPNT